MFASGSICLLAVLISSSYSPAVERFFSSIFIFFFTSYHPIISPVRHCLPNTLFICMCAPLLSYPPPLSFSPALLRVSFLMFKPDMFLASGRDRCLTTGSNTSYLSLIATELFKHAAAAATSPATAATPCVIYSDSFLFLHFIFSVCVCVCVRVCVY